jgi:hypothetical protein
MVAAGRNGLDARQHIALGRSPTIARRAVAELADAVATPTAAAEVPRTDAILLHPRPARVVAAGAFFHHETRAVQESYTVQVPYSTIESYSCGTTKSFRTCTRSVTRYRSETRHRTVLRSVRVTDAECARARRIAPGMADVYLLEFDFQAPGVCRLTCFQQIGQPEGSFDMRPCPATPVPKD